MEEWQKYGVGAALGGGLIYGLMTILCKPAERRRPPEKPKVYDHATLLQDDIVEGDFTEKFWVLRESPGDWKAWVSLRDNIHLYTSTDGVSWRPYGENPVLDEDVILQDPSVVKVGGTYYLYVENSTTDNHTRIYTSGNGANWTLRNEIGPSIAGIRCDPQSPTIFVEGGEFHLVTEEFARKPYNIAHFVSPNGISDWEHLPAIVTEAPAGPADGVGASPDSLIKAGGIYHLYGHIVSPHTSVWEHDPPWHWTSRDLTAGSWKPDPGPLVTEGTWPGESPSSPVAVDTPERLLFYMNPFDGAIDLYVGR